MTTRARVAVVGARGYVGRELLAILARHPRVEVALVTSGKDAGKRVAEGADDLAALGDLAYSAPSPEEAAGARLDAYLLALPNGTSEPWVSAIAAAREEAAIVDLSADHRFDDSWIYGQPDRQRAAIAAARRIANPGCYATAAQLALAPVAELLEGPPSVFGVSGYSGAGTTPSERNDPEALRENLLPYGLVDHVHEREVSRQLGRIVHFMPHVAPFFRGITVTVSMAFASTHDHASLWRRYEDAFGAARFVTLSAAAPLVRDVRERHETFIGGLAVSKDGRHAVVVATIDNLLGGAATQAVRNLNLSLGFPEAQGIDAEA